MNPLVSAPLRVLLAALGLGATVLPRRVELTIGPALGRLVRRLGLFKVKRAAEHIALCFPEKTPEEREAPLVANYEHYGILLFEFMHFFSPVPCHCLRYAAKVSRLVGREHWEAAKAKGKKATPSPPPRSSSRASSSGCAAGPSSGCGSTSASRTRPGPAVPRPPRQAPGPVRDRGRSGSSGG